MERHADLATPKGEDEKGAQTATESAGPLAGYRILEFGSFVAGPFAGQLLADLGADVIKVEPPTGDPWRHHTSFSPNESRLFMALNRGKRSVCLDLKHPEGVETCHRLAKSADAVVSNNRPDTAKKLKFDYQTLGKVNPSLVYCDISAYGTQGPKAEEPGFDLIMQGYTGAMANEGKMDRGHPVPVRSSSFIDYSSGYAAVNAVLAGLLARNRTGKGQMVTTSLLGNALAMQSLTLIRLYSHLSPAQEWMNREHEELLKRSASYAEMQDGYREVAVAPQYACYYRAYKTRDGALALGTLAIPARLRLLRYLGLSDPRIEVAGYDAHTDDAKADAARLVCRLEEKFASRTTSEWITELRRRDIPCEPVRFVEEMADDEQALANGYVVELEHPVGGRYQTSGPVSRFESGNAPPRTSPTLGQHTREVLGELGLIEVRIEHLLKSGAVCESGLPIS